MASTQPIKTIGYIGLGNAGYSLASVLAKSKANHNLIVRDADLHRAEKFTSEHLDSSIATTNSSFGDVDILITMLPNGSIVRGVLLDVAPHLRNGTIIVDTSSSSPFQTRETAELLRNINRTLILLDSPVTQEYAFALGKGDATLMVGCSDPSALERAMPVLNVLGKYVFHMGILGAGHAMKTLNNYVSAASILGLCDALVAGQKFGLEPGRMVEAMNVGTGVNFSTRESFRTDGLTRRFKSGYQLELLVKDIKIARQVIEDMGVPSSLPDLMVSQLEGALKVAGPGADHTEVIKGWEKKAGVELVKSKL